MQDVANCGEGKVHEALASLREFHLKGVGADCKYDAAVDILNAQLIDPMF